MRKCAGSEVGVCFELVLSKIKLLNRVRDVDGDGHAEVCYDQQWYGCRSSADCGSGEFCSDDKLCVKKCSVESGAACYGSDQALCSVSSPGPDWSHAPEGDAYCADSPCFCKPACLASGELCDSDSECCSSICQDKRTDFVTNNDLRMNYMCVDSPEKCVDELGVHGEGVYSGGDLLCSDGVIYRCASDGDACNHGSVSVGSAEYWCVCSASGCSWSLLPDENSAAGNCDDGFDNDCDGLTDYYDNIGYLGLATPDNPVMDYNSCCKGVGVSCTHNWECCGFDSTGGGAYCNPADYRCTGSGSCTDTCNLCFNDYCVCDHKACCEKDIGDDISGYGKYEDVVVYLGDADA